MEDKEPHDLDVVTFFHRPRTALTPELLFRLFSAAPAVFSRTQIKLRYHLDAMFVDMDATPEAIVDSTRYWAGVFSHRRGDLMWKGMLKVDLKDDDDDLASLTLTIKS